jgi:hypothetical protein
MASDFNLGYNDDVMERPASETVALVERLWSFSLPDGGLPYYRGNASSAEPTLLAALALSSISLRSVTGPKDPRLRQDDTLTGWPWVPGTFGWVEPTAWSLIALGLSGLGGHPRAEEGARFLLDRQIPSGGWNYGNPALDGKELLPFWDTTGLALVALHGHGDPKRVGASLELMEKSQGKIESLSGLSWAVLCLQGYGRDAGRARVKLLNVMGSLREEEFHAGNFALGLIALSGKKVFIP